VTDRDYGDKDEYWPVDDISVEKVAGVGAEVGAVFADVGVGARALDLGADAVVAAGEGP
jgi:hypothetical protein